MITQSAPAYGDLVPNQPKTQNRTMRIGDPEWESFGVFSEVLGTDRTKLVELFIDLCLGRDVALPAPLSRDQFVAGLRRAWEKARATFDSETDSRKKALLGKKCEALGEMITEVLKRPGG